MVIAHARIEHGDDLRWITILNIPRLRRIDVDVARLVEMPLRAVHRIVRRRVDRMNADGFNFAHEWIGAKVTHRGFKRGLGEIDCDDRVSAQVRQHAGIKILR